MVWVKSVGVLVGFLAFAAGVTAIILASPIWLMFGLLAIAMIAFLRYTMFEDE